jgi:hypothetical protein
MAIAGMLAGEDLNFVLGRPAKARLPWNKIRRLMLVGVICGFAALINPNGIRTWIEPFQTVGVSSLQKFIAEWASPDFHDLAQQSLLWLAFACAAAFGLSGRDLDGTDLVDYVLFGYMAFVARRNFGPFALVSAPILCRYLWPACQKVWSRFSEQQPAWTEKMRRFFSRANRQDVLPAAAHKAINLIIVGLLAFFSLIKVYTVSSPAVFAAYLPNNYPSQAVDWIEKHQPKGRMLSSYNWGGYLTWALPQYPVFLDGRTDLFNDEIIGEWIQVVNGQPGWQGILDKWGVNLVMLEPDRPVVGALERAGWKLLYTDKMAVIYGR